MGIELIVVFMVWIDEKKSMNEMRTRQQVNLLGYFLWGWHFLQMVIRNSQMWFTKAVVVLLSGCMATLAYAGPQVEHWTLDNGAQVYLVQSDALPMLDINVAFDAGSRRDPSGKAGLASIAAMMGDKGVLAGVDLQQEPAMDENGITEAWLDLGAIFSIGSGRDEFSYSLRTLTYSDVLPQAIALAARVIGAPSFPQDVLERDQARLIASLRESLTQPGTIASRAYNERVYGGHPYGALLTEESIGAVTTQDLVDFHAQYMASCRARIAMVGNVTREQADEIAKELLSRLPVEVGCPDLASVPEVPELTQAIQVSVPFDAAQAQIYIGQPGIKRNDPDFLVLVVANHILGGNGFSSQLMQRVREERGLTYGIGSGFSPSAHAGAFTIALKTRPDQAQEALDLSLEVLADFVANGPTQAELDEAKANLVSGFPLMYDSNAKLLAQVANIARNGLPLDYLDQWPTLIDAVTVEQVKAAMQRVIDPERLVTVVVGAKGDGS